MNEGQETMNGMDYVNTKDKNVGKSVGSEPDVNGETLWVGVRLCGANKWETGLLTVQGTSWARG